MQTSFPFSLRGHTGTVHLTYQANEDPERWGYGVLNLPWPSRLATGLPVLEAGVSTSHEGYAAVMGWIQVVRVQIEASSTLLVPGGEKAPAGEHAWVDGPPQLRGLGVPFVSFGHCPTLFDAPFSTESDIRFVADSFLAVSPDALISRRSQACFGLQWGYSTRTGRKPELILPSELNASDWHQDLPILKESYPEWSFDPDWLG